MRKPAHPGQILRKEFLAPLRMTQGRFAHHIGCDIKTINRFIKGYSGVTPAMAVKLGAALRTSAEFWLNLQRAVDLYEECEALTDLPKPLEALGA